MKTKRTKEQLQDELHWQETAQKRLNEDIAELRKEVRKLRTERAKLMAALFVACDRGDV